MDVAKMQAYGIDVGNGYAMVSLLRRGEPQNSFPPNVWFKEAGLGMPTEAFIAVNGEVRVGDPDVPSLIASEPGRCVGCVKRRLNEDRIALSKDGKPLYDETGTKEQFVNPLDVYAAIVRKVVGLANLERNSIGEDPLYDVVLAIPASFAWDTDEADGDDANHQRSRDRRKLIKQAVEKVTINSEHLNVVGILAEPAAAAFDYLCSQRDTAGNGARDMCAIVFDLGYGTFDTAIVNARIPDDSTATMEYDVIGTPSGVEDLGCRDWDDRLQAHIERMLARNYDFKARNDLDRERIRRGTIALKHRLTDDESAEFMMPSGMGGEPMRVRVTRREFEEMTQDLLDEALACFGEMYAYSVEHSVPVTHAVLSGGGSLMPMVKQMVSQMVPGMEIVLHNPSSAVSFGAARYAEALEVAEVPRNLAEPTPRVEPGPEHAPEPTPEPSHRLNQYAQFSYGLLEQVKPGEVKTQVHFYIPKGAKLPATATFFASSSHLLELRIYRQDVFLEKDATAKSSDCTSVIRFTFPVPSGQECEFTLRAEEDGSVTCVCTRPDGTMDRMNSFEVFRG